MQFKGQSEYNPIALDNKMYSDFNPQQSFIALMDRVPIIGSVD